MLTGDRRTNLVMVLAISFALFLFISMFLWAYSDYELGRNAYSVYQARTDAQQQETADEIAARCAANRAPIEAIRGCLREQVHAYQIELINSKDLQAQQDMAFWSRWMFYASFAGLVVSVFGLAALYHSLLQTRRAISNDREIGHAQIRAYLGFGEAEVGFNYAGNLHVSVAITNLGQTPARHCHVICEVQCRRNLEANYITTYAEPIHVGDIAAGRTKNVECIYCNVRAETILGAHPKDLIEANFRVGVFGVDVFGFEVLHIDLASSLMPLNNMRPVALNGADTSTDAYGDRELIMRAWSDKLYSRYRPKRRADSC